MTGRVLENGVAVPGGAANMTVAACTSACQAAGYLLAGCEYGGECWCDNTFTNGGTIAPQTSDGLSGCSKLCNGNLSEYCGGANRLDVYNFNNTIATILLLAHSLELLRLKHRLLSQLWGRIRILGARLKGMGRGLWPGLPPRVIL
jgi:hypothetical protein